MEDKFRLYIGLQREGKWFNYSKTEEIVGGSLAILDGVDKSGAARVLNIAKGAVKHLYTEDGDEYEMQEHDYNDLKVEDGWKIAFEVQKQFTGQEKPVFEENFFCSRCSTPKNEKYTTVNESWADLIEQGLMDEYYLDSPDCAWETELPCGIMIEGNREIKGGTFKKVIREPITIGEMIRIQNTPGLLETEVDMIRALWDAQIKEIPGMSQRALNIYVKRNLKDSFTKRYIIKQADIDAMSDSRPKVGIDPTFRSVQCRYCHAEIGGSLDFTNFFNFLFPKRSGRNAVMGI